LLLLLRIWLLGISGLGILLVVCQKGSPLAHPARTRLPEGLLTVFRQQNGTGWNGRLRCNRAVMQVFKVLVADLTDVGPSHSPRLKSFGRLWVSAKRHTRPGTPARCARSSHVTVQKSDALPETPMVPAALLAVACMDRYRSLIFPDRPPTCWIPRSTIRGLTDLGNAECVDLQDTNTFHMDSHTWSNRADGASSDHSCESPVKEARR